MKLLLSFLSLLCVGHHSFAQTTHTKPVTADPHSLREAKLPPQVKNQVAHVYSTWFQSPTDPPYLLPKEDVLNFRVDFPQLTKSGQQVILLESTGNYAGATGNGENWLYLRTGDNVRLILHCSGFLFYPAYSYDIPHPVYRNGLRDIAIGWRTGGRDGGIEVFRFNGHQYVSDHCANYTVDENETFHFGPPTHCQTQPK